MTNPAQSPGGHSPDSSRAKDGEDSSSSYNTSGGSDPMTSPSPYVPLPSTRSFRLLKMTDLQEGQNPGNIQVQCSLDIFELDEACPEYVTMSYTWGSPYEDPLITEQYSKDHDRTILVSHSGRVPCEQRIGRNLFEALVQVYRTKWKSYVWADAICINQSDNDERASQVQLMGDIYSRPEFGVAWLGAEPANIEDIRWWYGPFLRYFVDYYCLRSDTAERAIPTARSRYEPSLGECVVALEGSDITVSARQLLTLRDWFDKTRIWRRVWILQELTLPKKICYLLGPHDMTKVCPSHAGQLSHNLLHTWLVENVFEIATCLIQLDADPVLDRTILPPPPIGLFIEPYRREIQGTDHPDSALMTMRGRWFDTTTVESHAFSMLEHLLVGSHDLFASDQRDKVYGLLGIISRCCPDSGQLVRVTYEVTIQELLKTITIRLLTELPYMTCFSLLPPACYRRLKGLPSWVIDVTTEYRGVSSGGLSGKAGSHYNACPTRNETNAAIQFHEDSLQLYGHFCGNITQLAVALVRSGIAEGYKRNENDHVFQEASATSSRLRLMRSMGPEYRWIDGGQPISDALIQTETLFRNMDKSIDVTIGPDAFWTLVKSQIAVLFRICERNGADMAARALLLLADIGVLVLALQQSGVAVSPSLLACVRHILNDGKIPDEFISSPMSEADRTALVQLFHKMNSIHRCLFRTEHDFLGLATEDVKVGDQLWVLCRARTPQILRPLPDGTFQILGEAYVHGGVDGELIEKGIAGPLRHITIV